MRNQTRAVVLHRVAKITVADRRAAFQETVDDRRDLANNSGKMVADRRRYFARLAGKIDIWSGANQVRLEFPIRVAFGTSRTAGRS